MIGSIIMTHGDDRGLVLPPKIAPTQVIIIPIGNSDDIINLSNDIKEKLNNRNISNKIDNSDKTPGFRFAEAEVKGYPIRIEIGKRDLENKVVTLFNGIDSETFTKQKTLENRKKIREKYNIKDDDIVFIFSGRVCKDKGVKELVKAFINVRNKNKSAKLMIIGASFFSKKNKTKYIEELISIAKPFEKDIIFTGYIDYKNMGEIYSAADIQIVPSIFDDPCPLTVIEGMTMGLPQIVSNCGGIPEEVTEKNAIMVNRENLVNELENAMNKLILDKKLRDEMASESEKRAKLFTKEQYTDNFFKLLEHEFKYA